MSAGAIPDLLYDIIQDLRARNPDRSPLVGVSGAQGSGKTYWCRQLEAANRGRIAHLSIDDVYFTRAERDALAARVHPLFATRGPPGTHALELAKSVIESLEIASAETQTPLPRFDKAIDDRAPVNTWPRFFGAADAVLFDGWCLGALPDGAAAEPINRLEAEEDSDGNWRAMVRADLATRYQTFFAGFDAIVFLRAPSFEIVRRWRAQQEVEALGRAMSPEEAARLDRFIMHYERITRSMLEGNHNAGFVVSLDEERRVTKIERAA